MKKSFFLTVGKFFGNHKKKISSELKKKIVHTFQTNLRFFFSYRIFFFNNVGKYFEFFFVKKFFFQVFFMGFAPQYPQPGLRTWTPHAFGLRTLVGTDSRSTAFHKKP